MARTTRAAIDLSALVSNYHTLAELNSQGQTLAVIKADAYGHGAIAVARALHGHAQRFGVAFVDEARLLREQGITECLVLFEGVYDKTEAQWAVANNCCVVAHREAQLAWLAALDQPPPEVWLKIDTGMHRLGFQPSELAAIWQQYASLFNEHTVLVTHFACADDKAHSLTAKQLTIFQQFLAAHPLPISAANSAGIVQVPQAHGAWNRAGIALYGGQGAPDVATLKPVMTLTAPVIATRTIAEGETVGYGATWTATRESRIATVAIGYGDGYPRHAPSGTTAFCNGVKIELAGRVSMDMLTFDVTGTEIDVGDTVELWGANQSITEVAQNAGTIDYELMTRVSARVPRVYI
ncbi:alanine racemase [Alteromonas sp. ASW11-36]|uniref:Alanine racemase n=1 Tax=Alteromonas arenosi TaxID=3055817 RepID=A0ABT7SZA8_9ALTE|nr:alanine racemase [Alteromonas sp. ASW11-36]MDM7861520.1 alanine racemase [Alteromonas sp. ASW11-36]